MGSLSFTGKQEQDAAAPGTGRHSVSWSSPLRTALGRAPGVTPRLFSEFDSINFGGPPLDGRVLWGSHSTCSSQVRLASGASREGDLSGGQQQLGKHPQPLRAVTGALAPAAALVLGSPVQQNEPPRRDHVPPVPVPEGQAGLEQGPPCGLGKTVGRHVVVTGGDGR